MKAMTREEVRRVIEGKGQGLRVPLMYDFWIGSNGGKRSGISWRPSTVPKGA